MLPITVFYFKLLFTLLAIPVVLFINFSPTFISKIESLWGQKKTMIVFWFFYRIIPFVIVYIILDFEPRSDVPFFWYKASRAVKGGLVYVDFWSFHAPLYSYIIALPLLFWYSPKAIVLFMVFMEGYIILKTYRFYQNFDTSIFKKTLLYLAIPAPLVMVILGGQEDVWFWGIALLMLYYIKKYNDEGWKLGMIFSIGLVAIKATFVFWLFPLMLFIKNRISFLLGMAIVGIPAVSILYLLTGWKFLELLEHIKVPLSPNLFTVFRPFITFLLGHSPSIPLFNWLGLIPTLLTALFVGYKFRENNIQKAIPYLYMGTYISMTIFQLSAPGYYSFCYLIPVVFFIIDWNSKKDVAIFMLLNVILIIQPFIFTYLNSPNYDLLSDIIASPLHIVEYSLQVVNVVIFGWLLWRILFTFNARITQ